jgi:hypothetical protein
MNSLHVAVVLILAAALGVMRAQSGDARSVRVEGRVVDPTGLGLSATILLQTTGAHGPESRSIADNQGHFSIQAPAPGRYLLTVQFRGAFPFVQPVDASGGHIELGEIVLRFNVCDYWPDERVEPHPKPPPKIRVAGLVIDADGHTIPTATLAIRSCGAYATAITNSKGRFRARLYPDSGFDAQVRAFGFRTLDTWISSDEPEVIVMQALVQTISCGRPLVIR